MKRSSEEKRWKRNSDKHCLPATVATPPQNEYLLKLYHQLFLSLLICVTAKTFLSLSLSPLPSSPLHGTQSESLSLFRTFLLSFLESSGSQRALGGGELIELRFKGSFTSNYLASFYTFISFISFIPFAHSDSLLSFSSRFHLSALSTRSEVNEFNCKA